MLSWIRFIKQLVYTSFFGLLVYVFGVMGVSYYYAFQNMDRAHYDATVAADWTSLPLFLTTLLYATGGFNGVISCEATLKNPRNSTLMVLIGHISYVFTVLAFGAILYVAGYSGCSVVLDCLPQGIPVDVVKVLLTVALLFTYPVGLSYALDVLEDFIFTEKTKLVVRYIVRTCLVVITCVIAAAVPDFSVFSNFVGALCTFITFSNLTFY